MIYREVRQKRPMVDRKGNKVKKCYYFDSSRTCLGNTCFWLNTGECKFWEKINGISNGKKNVNSKNGKNGKR